MIMKSVKLEIVNTPCELIEKAGVVFFLNCGLLYVCSVHENEININLN